MLGVEDGSRCRDLTLKLTRIGVRVGSALVFKLLCSAFFSALMCALLCALKVSLRSYAHKRLQIQESQQNHLNFRKFTRSIHTYEQTIIWELCTKNAPWTELRQNWVVDFKKGIWDLTSSEQSARAEQEQVLLVQFKIQQTLHLAQLSVIGSWGANSGIDSCWVVQWNCGCGWFSTKCRGDKRRVNFGTYTYVLIHTYPS